MHLLHEEDTLGIDIVIVMKFERLEKGGKIEHGFCLRASVSGYFIHVDNMETIEPFADSFVVRKCLESCRLIYLDLLFFLSFLLTRP